MGAQFGVVVEVPGLDLLDEVLLAGSYRSNPHAPRLPAEGAGPVVLCMLRGGDMSLLRKFGKALNGSELHRCQHEEDEKKPGHGHWTPF